MRIGATKIGTDPEMSNASLLMERENAANDESDTASMIVIRSYLLALSRETLIKLTPHLR